MNILVIRNSYIIGGAELYYLKLQSSFNKFGLNYKIILITNNSEFKIRAEEYGITTYLIDIFGEEVGTKKGLVRLLFKLPHYVGGYINIINLCIHKYSIKTIILSGKTEKYILTPLLWIKKIKVLWIEHGRVFTPTMSKIALLLYRFSSLFCKYILAESKDTQKDLIDNNIDLKIIKYIGSGIDIDNFKMRKRSSKALTVGFMATLDWEKGVEDLIKTIYLTNSKKYRIQYYILGDGPQLNYLKENILRLNLVKYVHFHGRVQDVRNLLNKIDVLLSPIKHPGGISLSVLEAMSTGCVPIVTDVGGNRELIINNVTGYICNKNYPEFACSKIFKLLKERRLLNRISFQARSYIENNYSDKIFVERISKFL